MPLDESFYFAALEQIIFNADPSAFEIEVERHRSRYPFCSGWETTLSMFLTFTSREQSNVPFDVPMTRELTAVIQGSVKVVTFPDFSDCAGVPPHKNLS